MLTDIWGVTQIQGMGSLNLNTLSWILGSFGICKSEITQYINLIGRWNIKNYEFFLHTKL
jgi:hypothetical protein